MYGETGHAPENKINQGRCQKAERHKRARITAIGHGTHNELAHTITDCAHRKQTADIRVAVGQRGFHVFRHHRQIVTHQVKGRVSDKGGFHDTPAVPGI